METSGTGTEREETVDEDQATMEKDGNTAFPIYEDNLERGREGAHPDRKKQLYEVGVFLFLIVPSLVISLFVHHHKGVGFSLIATSAILRDLALVGLIFYFLWNNRESVHRIGLTSTNIRREVLVGIGLYVPFFLVMTVVENLLVGAGLSGPSKAPAFLVPIGTGEYVLAFVLVSVVALSEEVIFRGYLILRFSNISKNILFSALLSAFIFSLGHGYEGSAGIVTVGIMGFIFALIYLWRLSLVAPIVMHFLQDFIGIVIAPLISR